MKIAFVIYDINVCGGTHKQLLKLIEYSERHGQDFVIITKKLDLDKTYVGFKKYADKIKVYNYYDYPSFFRHRIIRRFIPAYNKWKLRNYIKDCNIINIHDNGFEDIYPLTKGKRVFWQINDLHGAFCVGVCANNSDTNSKQEMRSYIINTTKHFKGIAVNVTKNAELVKQCLGREAHVFYCGVEPVGIKRNIEESFQRFKKRQINLLSSGVFFPYRNYETQIKVVRILLDKGYDVKLNIIGDISRGGDYPQKIQTLIDLNNLHERIRIEGQVDKERFAFLHKQADMFLFINIDQSWGLAVFEAMSCSLPVIVSKSVGATEILTDKDNAIFVDPINEKMISEEIEKLINDEQYYRKIAEKASIFYLDWTWDKAYCSKMYNLMTSI